MDSKYTTTLTLTVSRPDGSQYTKSVVENNEMTHGDVVALEGLLIGVLKQANDAVAKGA